MATKKQLVANRRISRKCTGPKTAIRRRAAERLRRSPPPNARQRPPNPNKHVLE